MRRFLLYIFTILVSFMIDASSVKGDRPSPSNPLLGLSDKQKNKIFEGMLKEIGSIVAPYFYEKQQGKWTFNSPDTNRNEKAEELFKLMLTFIDIDAFDGYKMFQLIVKEHKQAIEQLKLLKYRGNWVLLARLWIYAFAKEPKFNAFYALGDADAIKKEIAMTNVFKEKIFTFLSSAGYKAPKILEVLKVLEDRMSRLEKLLPEEEEIEEEKQRSSKFLSQAQQEALIAQFAGAEPKIEEKTHVIPETLEESASAEGSGRDKSTETIKSIEQKAPAPGEKTTEEKSEEIKAEQTPAPQEQLQAQGPVIEKEKIEVRQQEPLPVQHAPVPENIIQAPVAANAEPEKIAIVLTEQQMKQPIDIEVFKTLTPEAVAQISLRRQLTQPEIAFIYSNAALSEAVCKIRADRARAQGIQFKTDPCKRRR